MIVKIVPFRICESVYTDGCGSNSVSVSSPLRRVPQFFSGSTGVLSGKYWSTFREGLESFPQGTGEVSVRLSRYFPRNGPGRAEITGKKFMTYIAD